MDLHKRANPYLSSLLFFMDYPFPSVIVYHKRKKKATVLIKANKHTNLANDVLVCFIDQSMSIYTVTIVSCH